MTEQTPVETTGQAHEVLITRVFDAPRELVFKAWTDPDQVARWWAPPGFHVPREKVDIDLRVGGRFHHCMVQTDTGAEFPTRYEILELVEPELIVLKSEPMPEFGIPESTITRIELHDHGSRTRMTLISGPFTATMRGPAEAGWNGSLDKLAGLLTASA